MLKLKFEASKELEAKIEKAIENKVNTSIEKDMESTLAELILATPIDTGYARSRWVHYKEDEFKVSFSIFPLSIKFKETVDILENDADYIQYLNQGSSKQAPAFFVEKTLINRGYKPTII